MICPLKRGRQYDSTGYCNEVDCAWWIDDKNCCAIVAIATSSLANLPNCKSGRVTIGDISPNYETVSSADAIMSEYTDFDYIYAFGGEG
jgi:hypothetical protein